MTTGSTWQQIVIAARQEATVQRAWGRANAIERAQRYLHDPRVARSWDETTDTLTIVSPQSGATYITNGTCQRHDGSPCPAFADGRACWHMEAKQLLRRLIDSIPPPADGLVPTPAPVSPQPDAPSTAVAPPLPATPLPQEPVMASAPQRLSLPVPLFADGAVVAYAGDHAEADHWFARHEAVFMSLVD